MPKPILIFPSGTPSALKYLKKCIAENRMVIGASSIKQDPSRGHYPAWRFLPHVSDAEFDLAMKDAVSEFGIGEIYTSNVIVWNYLNRTLRRLIPGVVLANTAPVEEVLVEYRDAESKADDVAASPLQLASGVLPRPMPAKYDAAALFRYAKVIPGMCDDDKLRALLGIMQFSVDGDIVEIGSWWGKSAFVLGWLARFFKVGKVLCVDPWSNDHLVQGNKVVDDGSGHFSAEEAFKVFQIGLIPFNFGHINYLRMTSVEGAAFFSECHIVESASFGTTEYSGQISILHIDGNHSFDSVRADVESWAKFVVAGGWIIFDDYCWPYGNGPQRVGDEFLETNSSRIEVAFVMGTALFIQLAIDR